MLIQCYGTITDAIVATVIDVTIATGVTIDATIAIDVIIAIGDLTFSHKSKWHNFAAPWLATAMVQNPSGDLAQTSRSRSNP